MAVYLAQFSSELSLIKIGYSKNPKERIKLLERYYGPAVHIYVIKNKNSSELERQLHKTFKDVRTPLDPQVGWYKTPRQGRTEFFNIENFKEIFDLPYIKHSVIKEIRYRREWFKYKQAINFKGNGIRPRL